MIFQAFLVKEKQTMYAKFNGTRRRFAIETQDEDLIIYFYFNDGGDYKSCTFPNEARFINLEKLKAWSNGIGYAQDLSPLSAEAREFLISGITPGEWDEIFLEEELEGWPIPSNEDPAF